MLLHWCFQLKYKIQIFKITLISDYCKPSIIGHIIFWPVEINPQWQTSMRKYHSNYTVILPYTIFHLWRLSWRCTGSQPIHSKEYSPRQGSRENFLHVNLSWFTVYIFNYMYKHTELVCDDKYSQANLVNIYHTCIIPGLYRYLKLWLGEGSGRGIQKHIPVLHLKLN